MQIRRITEADVAGYFGKLQNDFEFYAPNNLKITTKRARVQYLDLNRMQRRLTKLFIKQYFQLMIPVRWYVVKARQLGTTTYFSALLYWLTSMQENRNALFVAHDQPSARNIIKKLRSYYHRSLTPLKPRYKVMNRDMIHFATPDKDVDEFGMGLDSLLLSDTAESEELGRSYTFQFALLTEFCIWPEMGIDPESRLVSLNQCLPEEPETAVFIESSPKGENYGKEFWEDEDNGYTKIFISWLSDDSYRVQISYDEPIFDLSENVKDKFGDERAERHDILSELRFWYPEEDYQIGDFPGRNLVTNQSYESWIQAEAYCRLAWRRMMISKKLGGKKAKFDQEYPTTVAKAFLAESNMIFDAERVLELDHYIQNNVKKVDRYRYHHNPQITDYEQKFYEALYGPLRIFDYPKPGKVYVMGCDGAQGIPKGDDSAVVVLETPTLKEVASYNDIIKPEQFAALCHYLGQFYNNALLGMEINDKGGYAALSYLINVYHYPNLYYTDSPLSTRATENVKFGWHNNELQRQMLVNKFTALIDNGDLVIRSKEIVKQMKSFIKYPPSKTGTNSNRIAAAPGKHDDLVIAMGIAIMMAGQAHIPLPPPTKPPAQVKGTFEWHMQRALGPKKLGYGRFQKG